MPELNTDLTDLSDVTDEAIEAALRAAKWEWIPAVKNIRDNPAGYGATILLARCIQAHYPEMIVDPVTRKAREICAEVAETPVHRRNFLNGRYDGDMMMQAAKAAILAGMTMERGE